jgi:hypothetical protein
MEQHEIDGLVAAMLSAESGHAFRRCRRELERHDVSAAVHALIRGMRRATNQKVFDRAAKLLAEFGGDTAAEALAIEARSQRQYPRLAIRAFALCQHPTVVPVLLDLLESGRMKQRRAAAFALARVRSPLAVEALCKASTGGDRGIGPEATEALRSLGGPRHVARLVLGEPTYLASDHVRILRAVSASPLREGFWRATPFDTKRFLEREAHSLASPVRIQARAAADFLQLQSTLLRGAPDAHPDTLLRAASTPGRQGSDSLLRSSDMVSAAPCSRRAPARFWLRLVLAARAAALRVLGRP